MTIFVRGTKDTESTNELTFHSHEEFIKVYRTFYSGGKSSDVETLFETANTNKINMTFKTSGMEISYIF